MTNRTAAFAFATESIIQFEEFVKHPMNTKGGQFTMLNNILYLQNQKRKFIYFSRFVSISIFVFIDTISPNSLSLPLSVSVSLPSNALISNANMQNKSHTSSSELNKKVNCMLTEGRKFYIMYV